MSPMSEENVTKEQLLSRVRELEAELKRKKKYGLVWEDKPEDVVLECENKYPILKSVKSKRIRNNKTDPVNVLIEGDNYHALQILNYTHKGKVDVIYIDPPYNTGNKDFIYDDSFVDSEDGYRHSKWLSFMERRLKLAKELLKDTGVIFISIDDNEQAQLKLLCDGVFGEKNFITLFPRLTVKGGKTQSTHSTSNIDYMLVYARDMNLSNFDKILVEGDTAFKYSDKYLNERGFYHTKQSLDTVSLGYVKSLDYPINFEDKTYYPGGVEEQNGYRWTWSKRKLDFALEHDFVEFKNGRIWPKKYLLASIEKEGNDYYIEYENRTKNYSQLTFLDNIYSNTNGTKAIHDLGIENFNNTKPISLIKTLCNMVGNKNVTILDFFAGSGTTGHAVLELNKEDGGNRQFILVTNNGDEKSEHKIAEKITYERLKRVINGYKNKKGEKVEGLGGNLEYLKCDFIEKNKHEDNMKLSLAQNSTDMIALKENLFDLKIEKKDIYTIISNGLHSSAIYKSIDDSYAKDLEKELNNLPGTKSIYVNQLINSSDIVGNIKNIEIKEMPSIK
jgi:adenine-specific DNA-methyltransferase